MKGVLSEFHKTFKVKDVVCTHLLEWFALLTHIGPMFHFCAILEKSKNQTFSDVFREYRNGTFD